MVAPVVAFAVLTGVLAQVRIMTAASPVPITLQTLAVLLCGMTLPPARAAAAMAAYLAAGALLVAVHPGGFSLFAASSFATLAATGGFLIGFLVAAPTISVLCGARRPASMSRLIGAGVIGSAVIFVLGAAWIAVGTPLGVSGALRVGVWPFLPQAVVKLALAVAIVVTLSRGRREGHQA